MADTLGIGQGGHRRDLSPTPRPQTAQHRPRPVHRGPADLPIWHTREPGRRAGPRCAEKGRRGDRETRSLDRAPSARSLLRDLEALAPSRSHGQPWASRACTRKAGSDCGMIRACPPHESAQCPEIWPPPTRCPLAPRGSAQAWRRRSGRWRGPAGGRPCRGARRWSCCAASRGG